MSTPIPGPVAGVAALMSTFRPRWSLCGGWAVDAWLGRQTRDHHDVDIALFADDQLALFDHLPGWELIAHGHNIADDSGEPWDRRRLEPPAHIHTRPPDAGSRLPGPLRDPVQEGFVLEFQLNERAGRAWVFSREPRITLPWRQCIKESKWGLPISGPEVTLYYKAIPPTSGERARPELRPHDEHDLRVLLPHLTEHQRSWLKHAISTVDPGHPWLARLAQ